MECAICPAAIAADEELSSIDKAEPLAKVNSDKNEQAKFNAKIAMYEDSKNKLNGGRLKVTNGLQTVNARNTSKIQTKQSMGFLWPLKYWMAVHETDSHDRTRVKTIMHLGKKVSGIYMDHPGPDKSQAIEVWSSAVTSECMIIERSMTC